MLLSTIRQAAYTCWTISSKRCEAVVLRMERKLTLNHKAAHAVFMWNSGFEVERVMVGQSGLSGYVAPSHYWSYSCATSKRIEVILSGLAGGVAHRCFQTGEEKDKLLCSTGDM